MNDVERGRRMRELREAVGLLQRQVGAEFDIDKAAVSEWERGKSSPDKSKLVGLDVLYRADGEVLALYGINRQPERYATIEMAEEGLSQLRDLTDRVLRLEAVVDQLAAAVREQSG